MKIIRLALRSLMHFRSYTLVNIIGLALSLTCVIVIFRYVHGELTVDRFNTKLDRIFVSTTEYTNRSIDGVILQAFENWNKDTSFVDMMQHPAIESKSLFYVFENDEIGSGNDKYDACVMAVDENFLEILDFPVVAGTAEFARPDAAMVTSDFARKAFGTQDPIGKTLGHSSGKDVVITGIIEKPRQKSTLNFDVLVSSNLTRSWSRGGQRLVLLYPNQDYRTVNADYNAPFEIPSWDATLRTQIAPLENIYFNKNNLTIYPDTGYLQGNYTNVLVLLAVSIIILLVGLINFINIYTAVVLRRGREFGMKKVFGAQGGAIFAQLLAENAFMAAMAIVLALSLTEILNPAIKNLLGFDQLPFIGFDFMLSLAMLVALPLLTTIIPFLRYNYMPPITTLRSVGKTGGKGDSRKIMLGLQYVITIGMIIVSLFFVKQLNFMLNADLGFKTDNIIQVQFQRFMTAYEVLSNEEWQANFREEERIADEITQKMDASPLFLKWTRGNNPVPHGSFRFSFSYDEGEFQAMNMIYADQAWMELFEIELVDERLFNDDKDNFYSYSLVVAESALRHYGITDFRTARLQPESRLWFSSERPAEEMASNPPYEIVGVVKDVNTTYLGGDILPACFCYGGGGMYDPVLASIAPGKKQEAIEFMRQLHGETVGGEFTYSFIEDDVKAMYKEDKKVATVYSIFTAIAIIISMLGLFSMSLYDVQQRYREIAIRKVNGATTPMIVKMLLRKYFVLLGISFVIAVPVAVLAINRYLENFAHKTAVSWWIFAMALLVTAAVSLLTLIHQTRKAANTNPAKVIRSE